MPFSQSADRRLPQNVKQTQKKTERKQNPIFKPEHQWINSSSVEYWLLHDASWVFDCSVWKESFRKDLCQQSYIFKPVLSAKREQILCYIPVQTKCQYQCWYDWYSDSPFSAAVLSGTSFSMTPLCFITDALHTSLILLSSSTLAHYLTESQNGDS